jgi:hypothetical protein
LVTIDDVVDASAFLLENRAVTGVNLRVDGGWMLTWVSGSIDGVHDWGIWESAQGGLYLNDSAKRTYSERGGGY